jgi:RNA polymerase sigma factor (sigma-70 family)
MSYPRLIEWDDLGPDTREFATRALMKIGRLRREVAEELVQDAVVRIMVRRPMVTKPGALLVETAVNLLRRNHSNATNLPHHFSWGDQVVSRGEPQASEEPTDERADPHTDTVNQEAAARLHRALDRLRPTDREVLHAIYFQGRTFEELEAEQGLRPGTVRCQLHRARGKLLQALGRTNTRSGWGR